jgi:hypothetical protein
MAATRSRASATPRDSVPQSLPMSAPMNHQDHSFTLQAIMELQKSVTALTVSVESMQQSVDDIKGKVSKFEKILYAASVILIIALVIGGWLINTAKDFAMTHYRASLQAPANAPPTPPPSAPQARK